MVRLWSLHPRYLDSKRLVALWREALMAQSVLLGKTKGYTNHPQLVRFKATAEPVSMIGGYLISVYDEACCRGYHFDRSKIVQPRLIDATIPVTDGQMDYETEHLAAKLRVRDPDRLEALLRTGTLEPHPLFEVVEGPVADWERVPSQKL